MSPARGAKRPTGSTRRTATPSNGTPAADTCERCHERPKRGGRAQYCDQCAIEVIRARQRHTPDPIACAKCGETFAPYRTGLTYCRKPECRRASYEAQRARNAVPRPVATDAPVAAFTTRRCRNRDCIERFVPVNPQHWYHEPACALSERLWSVEEILAEEGALLPGGAPLEMAKAAFGQKNRAVRENLRLRSLRDYLTFDSRMFYEEHPEYRFQKVEPPVRDRGRKSPREIVVQLSDWQIGKWEQGFGVRETEERIEALKQSLASIVQRQRDAGYPVRTIRPSFGGDMIEGCFIYRGQNVTGLDRTGNTHRITRQIQWVARKMADFAAYCGTLADEVECEVGGGNHGRPNGPNDYADPEDNFDVMAGWWASDITANTKRIRWNVHDDWWWGFESLGNYIVGFHGDQWNGPMERLETLLPQWVANGTFGRKPTIVLTHHRHFAAHREIAGVEVYQNGTIDGGSRWYLKAYGRASRPTQNILVVSERHEVESLFKVRLGNVAA